MGENLDLIIALRGLKFYDLFTDFPTTGTSSKIYVDRMSNGIYLWNGTQYVLIAAGNTNFLFKGIYDASTGLPDAATTLVSNGDALIVSVAGTQTIEGTVFNLVIGQFLVRTESGIVAISEEQAIFQNIPNGRFIVIQNGVAQPAAIRETADEIIFDKNINTPPGSIELGPALTLSEIGAFINGHSNLSGRDFISLDYELNDNGTLDPIYYERSALELDVVIQPVDTTVMAGVTSVPVTPINDEDLHAITIDFDNNLTNFRARVMSDTTGLPVKYFPSFQDWTAGTGNTVAAGKVKLTFETPVAVLSSVDLTVEILADQAIDLNGNGTLPYYAIDRQIITELTSMHTGNVVDTIEAKTLAERLSFRSLKERSNEFVALAEDATIDVNNVETYRNDLLLFTNTSGVVTLTITDDIFNENDEIIVKHFTSSPLSSTGVNIIQEGTGAEIDGQTTLQVRLNTSVRLKYIGSNKWRIISSSMSGSTPTPVTPEAHAFSIDIPNRVNVNESPDTVNVSHNLSYSVTNHSLVTSAVLHIGTSAFVLSLPTVDGITTATASISGIDLSSAQNYNMYIELNMDTSLRSNIQVLRVANLPQSETMYYGVNSGIDFVNIDLSTLAIEEVLSGSKPQFTFILPINNYAIMLIPSDLEITAIRDLTLSIPLPLSTFTKVDDVRTIESQVYDGYSHLNESGVEGTMRVEITLGGV